MLKTTRSPEISIFKVGDGKDKVVRFGVGCSKSELP